MFFSLQYPHNAISFSTEKLHISIDREFKELNDAQEKKRSPFTFVGPTSIIEIPSGTIRITVIQYKA